jgi:hypothetical protein
MQFFDLARLPDLTSNAIQIWVFDRLGDATVRSDLGVVKRKDDALVLS